jgi:hypothetical protein
MPANPAAVANSHFSSRLAPGSSCSWQERFMLPDSPPT